MKLVFVHGWSVTSTDTYGDLPQVLQKVSPEHLDLDIQNIYLSQYISFHNEVMVEDIARAFESARKDKLKDEVFACITHSTGAPVLRTWIELYFKNNISTIPISHLIMLAPANHGSSLAILGKSKLSRIKSWIDGVQVGTSVLDWLQLGSSYQWDLNNSWIDYNYNKDTFYPFVLSGEKIDESFYDFINSYLVEKGSDGVIRLCGANMNYKTISLKQDTKATPIEIKETKRRAYPLNIQENIKVSPKSAFEVIPNASHSGDKYGIMNSVKKNRVVKPVVNSIIEALEVKNDKNYNDAIENMSKRTQKLQENKQQYMMFVICVKDNYGNKIDDYDMLILGGKDYKPDILPNGFFMDRQKNNISGHLVYYLNYNKLKTIKECCIGMRIEARPNSGFSYYLPAQFQASDVQLDELLQPNQTLMIEVILQRQISKNTFVLSEVSNDNIDFKNRDVGNESI